MRVYSTIILYKLKHFSLLERLLSPILAISRFIAAIAFKGVLEDFQREPNDRRALQHRSHLFALALRA
jgi:hypothetical protein